MDKYLNTIIAGDALSKLRDRKIFPDESVDLIITSPPYADKRNDQYPTKTSAEYVRWFRKIAKQCQRILKPQGSFILNIKEHVKNFERQPYTYELVLDLIRIGWMWREEYCWYKSTAFPGYWPGRFRDSWERVYHFSKQKDIIFHKEPVKVPIGDWSKERFNKEWNFGHDKNRHLSNTGSGFSRKVDNWKDKKMVDPNNVLKFSSVSKNVKHSAAFPVELPEWFIKLMTNENDIVLDPFMGSGTTAIASLKNGRRYVGIEIQDEFIDIANDRIKDETGYVVKNEIIFQELINSAKPIIDNDANLQTHVEGMYIYAFFLSENSTLKGFAESGQLLYLGITERGLEDREINEHLKSGKTGTSSFRRSLGAILKKELKLKAIPRTATADIKYAANYKFDKDGEEKLTKWILKNCTFGYYNLSQNESDGKYDNRQELEKIEAELTRRNKPALDLARKTRKYNINAVKLDALRKFCRQEVEKSYS